MSENSLVGKKMQLGQAIDYQADAVVSKTLLNKPAGTITLFAFDAGQHLSEHTAPFDAWVQIVEGSGTVIIGGREHALDQGDVIVMPANVPHAVRAATPFKMLLVMIKSGL